MVESAIRNGASQASLEHLEGALIDAFKSGATKDDILTVIELKVAEHETAFQDHMPGFPQDDRDKVYTKLPEGLIDVPTAAKKYNMATGTLRVWLRKGHLTLRGRLKAPATGGGYLVVHEAELAEYVAGPRNRGGRPRKT